MNESIAKLSSIFKKMVDNSNTFGNGWKNLKLGREAFEEMTENLPLRLEGELTPYTRIVLLNEMLDCMPQRDCQRFVLKVREYQESMFPLIRKKDLPEDMDIDGYEGNPDDYVRNFTESDLKKLKQKTLDFLDPGIPMEEWCGKYGVHLLFDEVERSEKWEEVIYDVDKAVARKMKGVRVRMGYCFEYWSARKTVLARYGIDWCSPSMMNSTVMFD